MGEILGVTVQGGALISFVRFLQTYGDAKDASTRLVEFANYGSFVGECPSRAGWLGLG
jgi:hypothetical protein